MEPIQKVNNWRFGQYLQMFKEKYCDPLNEKFEAARKIVDDPKYKWKNDSNKELAKLKMAKIETENIDFHSLLREANLIDFQHEKLVTTLSEQYQLWYTRVAYKGKQPPEMMSMQATELQKIFSTIYEFIEPLNLDVKPPEGYKSK